MKTCNNIQHPELALLSLVGFMVTTINANTLLISHDNQHKQTYIALQQVAKIILPVLFTLINLISFATRKHDQARVKANIGPTLRSAPMFWLITTTLDALDYAPAAKVMLPVACGQMLRDPKAPLWELSAAVAFLSGQLINAANPLSEISNIMSTSCGILAGSCLMFGAGYRVYSQNTQPSLSERLLTEVDETEDAGYPPSLLA